MTPAALVSSSLPLKHPSCAQHSEGGPEALEAYLVTKSVSVYCC